MKRTAEPEACVEPVMPDEMVAGLVAARQTVRTMAAELICPVLEQQYFEPAKLARKQSAYDAVLDLLASGDLFVVDLETIQKDWTVAWGRYRLEERIARQEQAEREGKSIQWAPKSRARKTK